MSDLTDVKVFELSEKGDERGKLVVIEGGEKKNIPFIIKRVFYIYDTDSNSIRGKHANLNSSFCLINLQGRCKVRAVDTSGKEKEFTLNKPNIGIFMPPMIWKDMYDFSHDAILLVLSDEYYDSTEYIHNYADFLNGV